MDDLTSSNTENVEPSPKRRRTFWLAAGVIVILGTIFLLLRQSPGEEPRTAKADGVFAPGVIEATPEQLKQIRIEPVREQTIDLNLEATGKVAFNEDRLTPVLASYPGRVLEVRASTGDAVSVGQPLLVVESPDVVGAVNDLIEAHTNVDKAKIALDIAEKSAERARRLHAQEALSTKELQSSESGLAHAQEEYRHAQSSVEVVRNRLALLGKSTDEIAQIENLPTDQTDWRVVIRAPIAGTIVERKVGLGQYVKPDNADPLFLIGDLSTVWITVDIYETDLSRIRIGAPVDIRVVAYPDRNFPARIAAINPTVDAATRTVRVRCLVPNLNGVLKPEMFARVRIGDAMNRKVLAVPSTAILTENDRSVVLVEDSLGRFRPRQVKSGREIGGYTVVDEGLRPNDRVVTSGVLLLSRSGNNNQ